MPNSTYGTSRAGVVGENDLLWLPNGYARDGSKRGIIYLHGAGELAASPIAGGSVNPSKAFEAELLRRIASIYPMVSVDAGVLAQGGITDSNNWGNPHAMTAYSGAFTWLTAAGGGGAKTDKVVLLGISMGHSTSLNWAQANPTLVKGIVGILPVNDLDDIRDNNRGGYQASISNAWGTGAWISPGNPALPATANPAKTANQTNLRAIQQRMYAANDDAICTIATANALVTNLGSVCTLLNMGNSGGHTDASVGAVPINDILSYLAGLG